MLHCTAAHALFKPYFADCFLCCHCSYGFDSSPILVDQFDCSIGGPYTVLFQCTFSTLVNVVNCDDNDDVGVSCCKLKIHLILLHYLFLL